MSRIKSSTFQPKINNVSVSLYFLNLLVFSTEYHLRKMLFKQELKMCRGLLSVVNWWTFSALVFIAAWCMWDLLKGLRFKLFFGGMALFVANKKKNVPNFILKRSSQERKNLPPHYFPFSGLRHLTGTRAVCIMACLISLICLVRKPSGLHPKRYSHVLPEHTWPEAEEHFLQCGWGRPASYGWFPKCSMRVCVFYTDRDFWTAAT